MINFFTPPSKHIKKVWNYAKWILEKRRLAAAIPKDMRFQNRPVYFYKTSLGNYYLPADAPDDYIAVEMRAGRIFEPEVVEIAQQYIKKGSAVLDVGANFGQMSLLFAQYTGEDGQVFSFEADDYVFYILQKNILVNKMENIRPFLGAVYDQSGEIVHYPVQDFKQYAAYGSYGLDPTVKEGRTVETLAIDDLDIRLPISFMKVDVQGSDLAAMRGAIKTITKHRMPIVFEFEQQFQAKFQTSFQDYVDFVSSIGYKFDRTVYGINYVIVPDNKKTFSVSSLSNDSIPFQNIIAEPRLQNKMPAGIQSGLCKFLKSRAEIDACRDFLYRNGFVSHVFTCKDWDLAHILPNIDDGNFLDMGSSDSWILKNLALKKMTGKLYGIDLRLPIAPVKGVEYLIGDLLNIALPDHFFKNMTCLSVIEHGINFIQFAKEAARLLEEKGRLFVTFDYWNPTVLSTIKMYGTQWQPLDEQSLQKFFSACQQYGLYLIEPMDWTLGDPVLCDTYYSPDPKVKYTFGIAVFEKQSHDNNCSETC